MLVGDLLSAQSGCQTRSGVNEGCRCRKRLDKDESHLSAQLRIQHCSSSKLGGNVRVGECWNVSVRTYLLLQGRVEGLRADSDVFGEESKTSGIVDCGRWNDNLLHTLCRVDFKRSITTGWRRGSWCCSGECRWIEDEEPGEKMVVSRFRAPCRVGPSPDLATRSCSWTRPTLQSKYTEARRRSTSPLVVFLELRMEVSLYSTLAFEPHRIQTIPHLCFESPRTPSPSPSRLPLRPSPVCALCSARGVSPGCTAVC